MIQYHCDCINDQHQDGAPKGSDVQPYPVHDSSITDVGTPKSRDSTSRCGARPLAAWVGGKRSLAARLIQRIAAIPHRLYAEPFIGMGGVFLRRPHAAPVEAINDRSQDVVNLFRIVRHHPDALLSEMRLQLVSRSDFHRLRAVSPETLTDVQRAARAGASTHCQTTCRSLSNHLARYTPTDTQRHKWTHIACLGADIVLTRLLTPWESDYDK